MRLNRDVNIFWGLNGTGKTSLLKILHAAMLNDAASIVQVPFESASVVLESEVTGKPTRRRSDGRVVKDRAYIDVSWLGRASV